jgi:hypothetical protein
MVEGLGFFIVVEKNHISKEDAMTIQMMNKMTLFFIVAQTCLALGIFYGFEKHLF